MIIVKPDSILIVRDKNYMPEKKTIERVLNRQNVRAIRRGR